jgi:hypothetical protein
MLCALLLESDGDDALIGIRQRKNGCGATRSSIYRHAILGEGYLLTQDQGGSTALARGVKLHLGSDGVCHQLFANIATCIDLSGNVRGLFICGAKAEFTLFEGKSLAICVALAIARETYGLRMVDATRTDTN